MAIAGSVLHELATHTLALAFFATHYGSLTDDFAHVPAIRNMHMSTFVDEKKCEVSALYTTPFFMAGPLPAAVGVPS
jgi:DNA mismatch repair protein MSH6